MLEAGLVDSDHESIHSGIGLVQSIHQALPISGTALTLRYSQQFYTKSLRELRPNIAITISPP